MLHASSFTFDTYSVNTQLEIHIKKLEEEIKVLSKNN